MVDATGLVIVQAQVEMRAPSRCLRSKYACFLVSIKFFLKHLVEALMHYIPGAGQQHFPSSFLTKFALSFNLALLQGRLHVSFLVFSHLEVWKS